MIIYLDVITGLFLFDLILFETVKLVVVLGLDRFEEFEGDFLP